jgi:putative heme-binding domain-containing protein
MGSPALALYERSRGAKSRTEQLAVLDQFVAASDDWTRSALVAAAADQAPAYVTLALGAARPAAELVPFVAGVMPAVLPVSAEPLLVAAASAGSSAAPLRTPVVRAIAAMDAPAGGLTPAAASALQTLLADPATAAAALPVAAKWDQAGALRANVDTAARARLTEFGAPGTSDDRRVEIAAGLLAVPAHRADMLAAVAPLLTGTTTSSTASAGTTVAATTPPALRDRLAATLGDAPGGDADAVLIDAFARTGATPVVNQLLRRPESALAFVAALTRGALPATSLDPGVVGRLRNHPNPKVAAEAAAYLDSSASAARARADVIAALLPEVSTPGNAARGRELFTAACATCHRLGTIGTTSVGPPLDGIGTHPRSELLAQIIDPNREVDPSFWQVNVTTRRGQTIAGVIASENASVVTLRNQSGDVEVRHADIATRETTRRSLMPEGLESLGAEAIRDILTFLASSAATAAPASPQGAAAGPKEGGKGDAPLPETRPIVWAPNKPRVLIVAGGSSHNFGLSFGTTDRATLEAAGFSVNYTEDRDQAAAEIRNADVAVISVNRQFFDTPDYRKALIDFAAAGKGLVILHPGTWYGYGQWPELNATIVGGGARGHDRIARFSVTVVQPAHPVMQGVAASFEVEDELYWFNAETDKVPAGTTAIDVLAETSPSVRYKRPHPAVWATRHPTARVVGITIGHDERVHGLDAFKTLLANAVRWAARVP